MNKMYIKRMLMVLMIFTLLLSTACSQQTQEPTAEEPAESAEQPQEETPAEPEEVEWPTQPINIMVPASAGGGTDMIARNIAEQITEKSGGAVVITNMTGLAGYEQVRVAEPDGYNYVMAITGLLISKAQGDLEYGHEAFDSVGMIGLDTSTGIIVRSDSPYQTLTELFDAIQADSTAVTGGISMTGYPYLMMLAIEDTLDIDLYCVDAGNSAERNTALLGGQVDFIISNAAVTKAYLESGDFRYLGVPAPERDVFLPDVPTFQELGYDFVFPGQQIALMASKGTDPRILEKFSEVLAEIINDKEFNDKMYNLNFNLGTGKTRAETDEMLTNTVETFMKYVE